MGDQHIAELADISEPLRTLRGDPKDGRRRTWAFLGMTLAALLAIIGLVQTIGDQRGQIDKLGGQSSCRSELAAAIDVRSGEFQIDLGRLVNALASNDQQKVASTIGDLLVASDNLQTALDQRAETQDICK